jgi:hypothetical protein
MNGGGEMRRVVLLLGAVLASLTVPRVVSADGSDSSGTHSYTSACQGGLPRFTNTSDPASTGNGVIEFHAAGVTLTLAPGDSGVLDPGRVPPDTEWQVVFFDLGQANVFDGGTFDTCGPPPTTDSVSVVEGCENNETVVTFTNTGTATIHAGVGTFARTVEPGATVTAPWPTAGGERSPMVDWHVHEVGPAGDIGGELSSGTALLVNGCAARAVVRNLGRTAPGVTESVATAGIAPIAPIAPIAAVAPVALTLTETAIEGLPDDLVAGVIDVTVTDQRATGTGEVNFSRVEPGTEPATFAADLIAVIAGRPFPDYFLDTAGAVGHSMLTLDEGEYIVWSEPADEDVTPDSILTAALTVGPGDDDAVIPPTDGGTIRAGDYLFDADVSGGGSTVTFTNSSDNQFHHVLLIDFGTNDPALIEGYFPTFLEREGQGPAPQGIDTELVDTEFGHSGVFGPGSSGTFDAPFEAGHTYVAMCFVFDRAGGLAHAFQHEMYDVFQVGGDPGES